MIEEVEGLGEVSESQMGGNSVLDCLLCDHFYGVDMVDRGEAPISYESSNFIDVTDKRRAGIE